MKNTYTKTFQELFWDQDDIRQRYPKTLFDNEVCSSFDLKPLTMPGLTAELQEQLCGLEYELKQFYLLTANMKRLCNSGSAVSVLDIQLAEVGVETVYYHHSEVFHDVESFLGNVLFVNCLSEANLERVKRYCSKHFKAMSEMLKTAVELVEKYGDKFSSVPKYYIFEEDDN